MTDILLGKTLLIVDDEPDLREPLVLEFEALGCRVFQASNGRDAFKIVQAERIDAVISDIRMPGGDGVELLRNIKELQHGFPMVMLITGFSDMSREEAYDMGAEAILAKPFDLDEIELAVRRILTPPAERWSRIVDQVSVRRTLETTFPGLTEAMKSGKLKLGRGGLFLQISSDHPPSAQIVFIRITFSSGELLLIEGTGVVRWVRRQDEKGLPPGCGIEFESLPEETRGKLLQIVEAMRLTPFIPKG